MALTAQQERQMEFHGLDIEGISFESSVAAFGSSKALVLGGAGDRGLEINGKFIKFTAIGIYVEDGIVPYLSPKLGGKSAGELYDSELLFEEVLSAPFEKAVRVVFLLPLTGPQYSEKVLERIGVQALYTDLKDEHKQQFLEIFKAENFPPRSSLFFSFTEKGLKVRCFFAFSRNFGHFPFWTPCCRLGQHHQHLQARRRICGEGGVGISVPQSHLARDAQPRLQMIVAS